MSLLTNSDLEKIIAEKSSIEVCDKLIIEPYSPKSLTPVGYDLRIGKRYSSKGKLYDIRPNEKFKIPKGVTILVMTLERIEMPLDLSISGLISSKVSVVAKGVSHISTTIDADWKGNLLIAITNISQNSIEFEYGQKFC